MYLLSGLDTQLVSRFMTEYDTQGKASTPPELLEKVILIITVARHALVIAFQKVVSNQKAKSEALWVHFQ